MTGGAGFVRDGMNSMKSNRRLISDKKDKHFKTTRPKSDFSRKYRTESEVDKAVIEKYKVEARRISRKDTIKKLLLLAVVVCLVAVITFLII